MTKLEEEILRAIAGAARYNSDRSPNSQLPQAKAAAEVAKRYIESAFRSGVYFATYISDEKFDAELKDFLKESGITE